MRDFSADYRWLSINTATVRRSRGADWPLAQILDACAARGIRAVAPWRDQVAAARTFISITSIVNAMIRCHCHLLSHVALKKSKSFVISDQTKDMHILH